MSGENGKASDPRIFVDSQGNVDLAWIDNSGGVPTVSFSRSSDGGHTFSAPLNISNHPGGAAHSERVTEDGDGNSYVVWSEDTSDAQTVFFARSTDNGASFSLPRAISKGSIGIEPTIVVDSAGGINLAWIDNSPGRLALFYSRSDDEGWTFSVPVQLSGARAARDPNIAVDSNRNIYLAWTGTVDENQSSDVFFSDSTNQGSSFSPAVDAFKQEPGTVAANPVVAAASPSNINILWTTGVATQVASLMYIHSKDGGASFGLPFSAITNGTPQLALDSSGGADIVWQESSVNGRTIVHFARYISGIVSLGAVIAGSFAAAAYPRLATDSNNGIRIALLASRALGGDAEVASLYSADNGTTFSDAESISSTDGDGPPQLATDPKGNAYLVWLKTTSQGNDVLFSRGRTVLSLILNPPSVTSDNFSQATVTLSGPAPPSGAVVSLSSSDSAVASVPRVVVVPAGAMSASFSVTASTLLAPAQTTLSASWNGITRSARLSVLPVYNPSLVSPNTTGVNSTASVEVSPGDDVATPAAAKTVGPSRLPQQPADPGLTANLGSAQGPTALGGQNQITAYKVNVLPRLPVTFANPPFAVSTTATPYEFTDTSPDSTDAAAQGNSHYLPYLSINLRASGSGAPIPAYFFVNSNSTSASNSGDSSDLAGVFSGCTLSPGATDSGCWGAAEIVGLNNPGTDSQMFGHEVNMFENVSDPGPPYPIDGLAKRAKFGSVVTDSGAYPIQTSFLSTYSGITNKPHVGYSSRDSINADFRAGLPSNAGPDLTGAVGFAASELGIANMSAPCKNSKQYEFLDNAWNGSGSEEHGFQMEMVCNNASTHYLEDFYDNNEFASFDQAGNFSTRGHLNQLNMSSFAGTCTMASGTSCTFSLSEGYNNIPICIATVQGTTPIAAACSVSGTTVTITAASPNSALWAAALFGNPN